MNITNAGIRKIAIFRALQLGDLLCSIPAIRAIRNSFPAAEISLIGLPWSSILADRFTGYFDGHISFPGYPGLPEQPVDVLSVPRFISEVQSKEFDLVLQMHGCGRIVNPLVACFNARNNAGFYEHGQYKPSPYFMPYPDTMHEIHRHLALVEFLGMDAAGDGLEFPLEQQDFSRLQTAGIFFERDSYVCIHPGTRDKDRQWPLEAFASMGDRCADMGYKVVITGTAGELKLAEEMRAHMKGDAIITAGKTDLGSLGALIFHAKALLSNCTGIAHLAAALGTRSVVVSLNREPWRWKPLDQRKHVTIEWLRQPQIRLVHDAMERVLSS